MEDEKRLQTYGIMPETFDDQWRIATALYKSGLCPSDCRGAEDAFARIQAGGEIGLKPFQSIKSIAVINGRTSMWGDAVLGLVRSSGKMLEYSETPITDKDGNVIGFTSTGTRNDIVGEITNTFTIDDAKKAGLWGKRGPWVNYPQRMLKMRARSWTLRDGWPDVLMGVQVAEEAMDMTEIIDVLETASKAGDLKNRLDDYREKNATTEPEQTPEKSETKPEPVTQGDLL